MNTERRALLVCAIGVSWVSVRADDADFERAMQDYEMAHHGRAFDALARLADAGHGEAARVALLMSAHGRRLYGQAFDVDAARRARWLDAAAPAALRSAATNVGARR
jgi:hypothetical protein